MSSHVGPRPGSVAPHATPESGKPALAKPASLVETQSAGSHSRLVVGGSATVGAGWPATAPWSDIEIRRFLKRVGLFERRGLPTNDAEALADSLVLRDRDRDDRRCCVECDSLQQSGTCFRSLPISRTQLVRCFGFRWQQP